MPTPLPTPDASASALGAFVCLLWLALLLCWLVAKSRAIADAVAWFRRQAVPVRILAACSFLAIVSHGGNKGGGMLGMRPPAASTREMMDPNRRLAPPPAPAGE